MFAERIASIDWTSTIKMFHLQYSNSSMLAEHGSVKRQ
jgi:hypothetical protein